MLCPSCKAPIPVGKRSCARCAKPGGPPSRGARPRAPRPASQNSTTVILIVVGLLVAVGGGYVLLGKSQATDAAASPSAPPKRDPLAGLPEKVRDPKAQLGEDQDQYVHVNPGEVWSSSLEADRALVAVFDVTPTDGPVAAAAMKVRSAVSMTPEDAAAFDRTAVDIKKGATSIVHCEAVANELVGCFVKNKGTKSVNVRIRRRWWGLEEQAPEPKMEVHSERKILLPGGEFEVLIQSDRRSKGAFEILPSSGAVGVATMEVRGGKQIDDADKKALESKLSDVIAPSAYKHEWAHNPGDVTYCLVRNRGEKPATLEVRHTTGLRR